MSIFFMVVGSLSFILMVICIAAVDDKKSKEAISQMLGAKLLAMITVVCFMAGFLLKFFAV